MHAARTQQTQHGTHHARTLPALNSRPAVVDIEPRHTKREKICLQQVKVAARPCVMGPPAWISGWTNPRAPPPETVSCLARRTWPPQQSRPNISTVLSMGARARALGGAVPPRPVHTRGHRHMLRRNGGRSAAPAGTEEELISRKRIPAHACISMYAHAAIPLGSIRTYKVRT